MAIYFSSRSKFKNSKIAFRKMTAEERLKKLQEMEAQKPGDAFLNYAIALEYVNAGNDNEAQTIFEALLQKNSDYIATYYQFGKLLERNGVNEKAIIVYKRGVELAKQINDKKNLGELNEALMMLEE
ncbi:MAG: hypothetical protein NTY88_11525 [Bacteroidetes bacterium]|nr:hypothetical protein [Bacteroidota bacterium]